MYNFQCVQVQCVNVGIDCTISMCKAVCKCTLCYRVVNVSFIFYISLKYVACTSAIFDKREITLLTFLYIRYVFLLGF